MNFYFRERWVWYGLLLCAILWVLVACSEEQYCKNQYILYYESIILWDGSQSFEPVYTCGS